MVHTERLRYLVSLANDTSLITKIRIGYLLPPSLDFPLFPSISGDSRGWHDSSDGMWQSRERRPSETKPNNQRTNMKRILPTTLAALALSATLSLAGELLDIDRAAGHALDAFDPVAFVVNKTAVKRDIKDT